METYSLSNQRNRYHLYLSSADAQLDATNAAGKAIYRNVRPQGYIYDPSKYRGCIIGLGCFASGIIDDTNYTAMCNNQQVGVAGIQQGSAPFIRIASISQPQSISNLNNVAGGNGVSNYSSNAAILKQLEWRTAPLQTAAQSGLAQLWYQACEDPITNGIYTSSPLDDLEIEIIDRSNTTMNFTGMADDQAGTAIDLEYQLHLVIQPLLENGC